MKTKAKDYNQAITATLSKQRAEIARLREEIHKKNQALIEVGKERNNYSNSNKSNNKQSKKKKKVDYTFFQGRSLDTVLVNKLKERQVKFKQGILSLRNKPITSQQNKISTSTSTNVASGRRTRQ